MSGTLGSLFDSLFLPSFRGVEFEIPTGDREAGRRVQRFAFPGRDGVIHQDLGGVSGRITVNGEIIGDDYVRRALQLEEAFNTPGPGTLIHPWYGELQVVLVDPCPIQFDERRIRFATFSATFEPWIEQPAPARDTFGDLLAKADALRAQVRGFLRRVLAPVRLALGVIAAVRGVIRGVASVVRSVIGFVSGGGSGILRSLLRGVLGDLDGLFGAPASRYSADVVYGAIAAAPAAIAAAGTRPPVPLIAPGGGATDPAALVEARVATGALLAGAAALPQPQPVAVLPAAGGAATVIAATEPLAAAAAVTLAARCAFVAAACEAAGSIEFESREEARSWQARLETAIAGAAADAALAALADPEAAGPVWRGLLALRSAVAADMHERIGRLPPTRQVTSPAARVPAWVIAQHVAGDSPGRVRAVMEDLVRRNRILHPSAVPPGAELEWLP